LVALSAFVFQAHAEDAGKKKIVLIAGNPSHGYGEHEHNGGCMLLAKRLNESGLGIETAEYDRGWPADPKIFDGAAAVVIFCDGGAGHVIMKHLDEFNALAKKGVGIGCIHYAVEIPKGDPGAALTAAIGGYFETFYSVNPHWTAEFKTLPTHPITRGVKPFSTNDEWYFHMRFSENMAGVTPILTAVPPDSVRRDINESHNGNPIVHADAGKNVAEHVVWCYERPNNGGRGFGCTGAHYHANWSQDDFRKTILNAIVWTAGIEVPANGVESKRPDGAELALNLTGNKKMPAAFDFAKKIEDVQSADAKFKETNK
jgi:type 1 glutamine amidotransferase